jgi:hypothetical protein
MTMIHDADDKKDGDGYDVDDNHGRNLRTTIGQQQCDNNNERMMM